MNTPSKKSNAENYRPRFVTQAFKSIMGQTRNPVPSEEAPARLSNGHHPEIDSMTLVQLPALNLKASAAFYTEALGLALSHPERPIESNVFVQTSPKLGPALHLLETPEAEFRHLHRTGNRIREECVSFYVKSLASLRRKLQEAGAAVVREPAEGHMTFLDPEGHLIGAFERRDPGMRFESNIMGFRHVRMEVRDPARTAAFFERALGFERAANGGDTIDLAVASPQTANQPFIRLVQAPDRDGPQPMHWMLDGRPKHALELHSKNIGALMERILAHGGAVEEALSFTGCGGYLKFHTPDGHYIWINQDRSYCGY